MKTYDARTEQILSTMEPERAKKWRTNPMMQWLIEGCVADIMKNLRAGRSNTRKTVDSTPALAPAPVPAPAPEPEPDGDLDLFSMFD